MTSKTKVTIYGDDCTDKSLGLELFLSKFTDRNWSVAVEKHCMKKEKWRQQSVNFILKTDRQTDRTEKQYKLIAEA